jgi:hypothetical protein
MKPTHVPAVPSAAEHRTAPRIVVLEGSPSQIGRTHGELLKPHIRLLSDQMQHLVFRRVGLVRAPALWVVAGGFARLMYRHFPAHLREEMGAIAEASGVPFSSILLLNCLDDVLNVLRRLAPRTPIPTACSSFALWGGRTPDGGVLHGRNLDYHFRGTPLDDRGEVARLMLRQTTLLAYRPDGRVPFLSIGWPGMVGTATAINGEGITLGSLTSYLRGASPNGVPATILYRRLMEEARSLEDTAALLRSASRTIGNNLMVSSGREGRAILFEITRDRVEESTSEEGALVATNHFTTPILSRRQRPYMTAHSMPRWERLHALCNGTGIGGEDRSKGSGETAPERTIVGPEEAMAILGDSRCARPEHEANPLARVANVGTAVSVLFQPGEMRLWLGMNPEPPASQGRWTEVGVRGLLEGTAMPTIP